MCEEMKENEEKRAKKKKPDGLHIKVMKNCCEKHISIHKLKVGETLFVFSEDHDDIDSRQEDDSCVEHHKHLLCDRSIFYADLESCVDRNKKH